MSGKRISLLLLGFVFVAIFAVVVWNWWATYYVTAFFTFDTREGTLHLYHCPGKNLTHATVDDAFAGTANAWVPTRNLDFLGRLQLRFIPSPQELFKTAPFESRSGTIGLIAIYEYLTPGQQDQVRGIIKFRYTDEPNEHSRIYDLLSSESSPQWLLDLLVGGETITKNSIRYFLEYGILRQVRGVLQDSPIDVVDGVARISLTLTNNSDITRFYRRFQGESVNLYDGNKRRKAIYITSPFLTEDTLDDAFQIRGNETKKHVVSIPVPNDLPHPVTVIVVGEVPSGHVNYVNALFDKREMEWNTPGM